MLSEGRKQEAKSKARFFRELLEVVSVSGWAAVKENRDNLAAVYDSAIKDQKVGKPVYDAADPNTGAMLISMFQPAERMSSHGRRSD